MVISHHHDCPDLSCYQVSYAAIGRDKAGSGCNGEVKIEKGELQGIF
jgi:hypothetical protein